MDNNEPRDTRHVCFIGGGNIAAALVGALVASGYPPHRIGVTDPDKDKLARLQQAYGVKTHSSLDDLPGNGTWVWAVKPQSMREATSAASAASASVLHISVAAGVRTTVLRQWLGTDRLVRAMPNTPVVVRAGVTGLFTAPGTSLSDRQVAEQLFRSSGYAFWVESEDMMDAVTGVSGSGPAYVFYFLEALQAAAQAQGLPADRARELALQVVQGAVTQSRADSESFATLRDRVTSPGGTTAAGLAQLELAGMQPALVRAVEAATQRARELGFPFAS